MDLTPEQQWASQQLLELLNEVKPEITRVTQSWEDLPYQRYYGWRLAFAFESWRDDVREAVTQETSLGIFSVYDEPGTGPQNRQFIVAMSVGLDQRPFFITRKSTFITNLDERIKQLEQAEELKLQQFHDQQDEWRKTHPAKPVGRYTWDANWHPSHSLKEQ